MSSFLEVSTPAKISVRDSQIVVVAEGGKTVSVPPEELEVLSIAHPQSEAVLTAVASHGGVTILSDHKFQPAALVTPLVGRHDQSLWMLRQAGMSEPRRKQIWRELVSAKIRSQGRLLTELKGDDCGLFPMSSKVASGDTGNLEAQAARIYWRRLLGAAFARDQGGTGINAMLDYGYGILRAMTVRSLCACGLNPALGIHHRNQFDSFPLASDFMKPFRALVDKAVANWGDSIETPLGKAQRHYLAETLYRPYTVRGKPCELPEAIRGVIQILFAEQKGGKPCGLSSSSTSLP